MGYGHGEGKGRALLRGMSVTVRYLEMDSRRTGYDVSKAAQREIGEERN